jgi:Domain of unknown function (DUF1992)
LLPEQFRAARRIFQYVLIFTGGYGMSIEKFVEDQIKKAMAEGEFDNLPGKGKPIDLDAYFQTPEDLRICYSILKGGSFVPEEVQMLKDIEALREQLASCTDEARKKQLEKTIREKVLSFNLTMERYKRSK